jgi:signal peptide peptidase SppA
MRFLTNALSGREALLIDPVRARQHADAANAAGLGDMIAQFFGEKPRAYKAGKVGIVPLRGVVGKSLLPIDKMTGAVDLDDFDNDLEEMENDDEVEVIIIDISSPGGTVTGVEEVASRLARYSKPTVAFTDTEAASAAYWIGAAADRFVATPSASVGSVGVYMAIPDFSEAYRQAGISMQVVKAGKLKGAGIEGTSLTDEQKADLQEQVNGIHADFKASVRGKRKLVKDEDMEGQVFSGKVAARKGMVTGLVGSLNELIRSLNA